MAKRAKPILGVTETIETMIANWPTLYRSRDAALERIFTDTYEWRDGAPYQIDSLITRDETDYDAPVDETEAAADHSPNSKILYRRIDAAKAKFVRDNAALIARAEYGDFQKFTSVPSFSTYKLNSIPVETLTDEWKTALAEYCNEVLRYDGSKIAHRTALKGYRAEYGEREVSQLEGAKKAAQECLHRLGKGTKAQDEAREMLLSKLRAQAAELGFDLTKMA
jgi:hypothetical protein